MTKQLQVFLTGSDEAALSARLVEALPDLVFVDDNVWPSPKPMVRPSIAACSSFICFLWDRAVVAELPTAPRPDGNFEGPVAGPVVQVIRSRPQGELLLSGRIAASPLTPEGAQSVKTIWKVVRRWGCTQVRSVDPMSRETILTQAPGYLLGPDAVRCWSDGSLRLRDRSTESFLAPVQGAQLGRTGRPTMQ